MTIAGCFNKNIFDLMTESAHTFYPTGSRYFGGSTSTSDYDFYASDEGNVRQWLRNLDFTNNLGTITYDEDPFASIMMERHDPKYGVIHIQLIPRDKIDLKTKAQTIVDSMDMCHMLKDKPMANIMWKIASNLAKNARIAVR